MGLRSPAVPHTQHLVHMGTYKAIRPVPQRLQTPGDTADAWTCPQAGQHLPLCSSRVLTHANNPGPSGARVTPDPGSKSEGQNPSAVTMVTKVTQWRRAPCRPRLPATCPRCPYLGADSLVGRAPRKGRGSPGRCCPRWIHKTSSHRTQGRTFLQRKQNKVRGEGEG